MATINRIEPFPADIDRAYFGIWLAGFTDGEGSFTLRQEHRIYTSGTKCTVSSAAFAIGLRSDDFAILSTIQSFFSCGEIQNRERFNPTTPNGKPSSDYRVQSVSDLAAIVVPFFDAHPLLAKKKRDFAIWREGVLLCDAIKRRKRLMRGGRTGTLPKWKPEELDQFAALSQALKDQREFLAPEATLPKPLCPPPCPLFDGIEE